MSKTDFENDEKRQLQMTDPSGNTSIIEPGTKPCPVCNAKCVYSDATCKGQVDMMSDMHLCETHKKERHGAPNNWYESVETNKDGPVQRMIGVADKELSNWGGTYDEKEQSGEDDNSEIRE